MEEKLCLKWNEFQENVTSTLGDLRADEDFTDVTLACEGSEFEVHRWILASCSTFFRTVLNKTKKHQHPLIYMRGVTSRILEAVVDFIYKGEASILQGDLDAFLLIAEEIQLKGLAGLNQEKYEEQAPQNPSVYSDTRTTAAPNAVKDEIMNITENKSSYNTSPTTYGAHVSTGTRTKPKFHIEIPEETVKKVESMIRKQDGAWICLECNYKSNFKGHLKEHAEKHIEGLQYPCNFCGKIMRSYAATRQHIGKYHSNKSLHFQL